MDIKTFIKKRPYLIWHTKNFNNLSEEVIVESVLNYGDFDDVKEMIKILGIEKTAGIFRKEAGEKRNNYRPEIKNYFKLYFNRFFTPRGLCHGVSPDCSPDALRSLPQGGVHKYA